MEPWDQTKSNLKQAQRALELWDEVASSEVNAPLDGNKNPITRGSSVQRPLGKSSPEIQKMFEELKQKLKDL